MRQVMNIATRTTNQVEYFVSLSVELCFTGKFRKFDRLRLSALKGAFIHVQNERYYFSVRIA